MFATGTILTLAYLILELTSRISSSWGSLSLRILQILIWLETAQALLWEMILHTSNSTLSLRCWRRISTTICPAHSFINILDPVQLALLPVLSHIVHICFVIFVSCAAYQPLVIPYYCSLHLSFKIYVSTVDDYLFWLFAHSSYTALVSGVIWFCFLYVFTPCTKCVWIVMKVIDVTHWVLFHLCYYNSSTFYLCVVRCNR